jgi:hypothetical protein
MSKAQNRTLLGLAIAALVAIFFYEVAYGKHGSSEFILGPFKGWNQTSSWIKLAAALMQHDANDQRIEYNILNGSTWNIVNSTDGTTATISFDIAPPGCSYNGHRACTYVINWWSDQLQLGYSAKTVELTFKTVSQDHIELQDSHGDTIRLMRNGMPLIAKAETDCSRTDLT